MRSQPHCPFYIHSRCLPNLSRTPIPTQRTQVAAQPGLVLFDSVLATAVRAARTLAVRFPAQDAPPAATLTLDTAALALTFLCVPLAVSGSIGDMILTTAGTLPLNAHPTRRKLGGGDGSLFIRFFFYS
jgi:hypothetical protein